MSIQNTVQLVEEPTATDEEIIIAVGGRGNAIASGNEVSVEWIDGGMLRIKLPSDKRRVPLKVVANGAWEVGKKGWR